MLIRGKSERILDGTQCSLIEMCWRRKSLEVMKDESNVQVEMDILGRLSCSRCSKMPCYHEVDGF